MAHVAGRGLEWIYYVADLSDFEEARQNVRVFQVKELVQPEDITFPLKEIETHVRLVSPAEEVVDQDPEEERPSGHGAPRTRAYTVSTRPASIPSHVRMRMQYRDRLRVGAEEAAKLAARSEGQAEAAAAASGGLCILVSSVSALFFLGGC